MIRHLHFVGAGRYLTTAPLDCDQMKLDDTAAFESGKIAPVIAEIPIERWFRVDHRQALILYEAAEQGDEDLAVKFLRMTCEGLDDRDCPSEYELAYLARGLIAHRPCAILTIDSLETPEPSDDDQLPLAWIARCFLGRDQTETAPTVSPELFSPPRVLRYFDPAEADTPQNIEIGSKMRARILEYLKMTQRPYASRAGLWPDDIFEGVDKVIPPALEASELVLWRNDLFEIAWDAGEAYVDSAVAGQLLPKAPQFWHITGTRLTLPAEYGDPPHALIGYLLTPSPLYMADTKTTTQAMSVIEFAVPLTDENNSQTSFTPRIRAVGLLLDGMPVRGINASIAACMGFASSEVAEIQEVKPSRQQRRQAERQGHRSTPVGIVMLKRRERSPNEDSPLSEREYQSQWVVRAHVEAPGAGMTGQQPAWVRSYV